MLLRPVSPALVGACLLLSLVPTESRGTGQDLDVPMRLCGRDFIRTMMFICGQAPWRARWKRSLPSEPQPESDETLASSGSDEYSGKWAEEFIPGLKEEQVHLLNGDQDLLKNMLNAHGHTEDSTTTTKEFLIGYDEVKKIIEKNKNSIKITTPLKQNNFMSKTHSRKKRMANYGISDLCCYSTCTVKDIIPYC